MESEKMTAEAHKTEPVPTSSSYFYYDFAPDLTVAAEAVGDHLSPLKNQNFFKSAHWSPDGSSILTNSNDNVLRIFNVPQDILAQNGTSLVPVASIEEGETVYDVAWYPFMNAQDPSTCCFLSSVRDHPVVLYDATSGKPRCSYAATDHLDQIAAPNCVEFNLDASRIYCGFDNAIRVFDTNVPGREFDLLQTCPTRKSKDGQKGLISCLTFNPDKSGLYAAGSFSKTIGLYDENQEGILFLLKGHTGGLTHMRFSHDGKYLYSGARRDSKIYCWDVRNTGGILFELERPIENNQRINFELDPSGRYLITGSQEGDVSVYDLQEPESNATTRLIRRYPALHGDTITSASLHPYFPLLITCSGQRKFFLPADDETSSSDSSDSSDSDSDQSSDSQPERGKKKFKADQPRSDNTLRVWKVGCHWVPSSSPSVPDPNSGPLAEETQQQHPPT